MVVLAASGNPPDYLLTINFTHANITLTQSGSEEFLFTAPVALPEFTPVLPVHAEVVMIIRNPWWYPTAKTRQELHVPQAVSPENPQNEMGKCKFTLHFLSGCMNSLVRIHGTNHPASIGKRVTRGCIRMKNEDILKLADLIDGTHTHVYFTKGP